MDSFLVNILTLLIGLIGGVAGGLLGIGGGVVLVPMLLLLFAGAGLEGVSLMHLAVATSLASIVFTGATSTLAHHRRGSVDWPVVRRLAPGLVFGAALAGGLGWLVDEVWLRRLFAVFLLFVALRLARASRQKSAPSSTIGRPAAVSAAVGIGLFSALVGIGGGSLTVPLLRRLGRHMQMAVGSASACGVPLAVGGTVGWMLPGWQAIQPLAFGYVMVPVALLLGLGGIAGALIGAALAHRLAAATLQRVFALVVAVIGAYLLSPLAR